MSAVIKVENLSKQYRLGQVGTGTISHDVNRWWHKIRGKEDPYLKIGESNDRTVKGDSDYVWVLKDINFEVKQGEVLGIIGRNGAGKSTLLKILSRTTAPTTGSVKIKGRVASLLEVGTGFHPELSGRDNIFLNGAILGMTKREIQSKFDEIVDFAGVERYIDTPVKRYSSGMYVRLAFGVAAHLEPEILIVDEVLAVGDTEFQKKALGKMKDVSDKEGRTVLFVSHNIAAIKSLCIKSIVMENGIVGFSGSSKDGLDYYLRSNRDNDFKGIYINENVEESGFLEISVVDKNNIVRTDFGFDEHISIKMKFRISSENLNAHVGFRVVDKNERVIFTSDIPILERINQSGSYEFLIKFPLKLLVPNVYKVTLGMHYPNVKFLDYLEECVTFQMHETGSELKLYGNTDYGCVFAECNWIML